jgi:hypothetical protein
MEYKSTANASQGIKRTFDGSAHACSEIGLKWFLFFASWDLWAIFWGTALSGLFAVSAFLEPAEVPYAAERKGHNRQGWV